MAKERFGRALMCSTVLRVPQAVYAKTILAKNCIPLSAYLGFSCIMYLRIIVLTFCMFIGTKSIRMSYSRIMQLCTSSEASDCHFLLQCSSSGIYETSVLPGCCCTWSQWPHESGWLAWCVCVNCVHTVHRHWLMDSWTPGWPEGSTTSILAPSPSRTLFFSYSWIEVFLLHLSVHTGHIKNGLCNVVISSSLSVAHPIMSSCSGCWSLQFAGALAPKYRHTPWVNMDTFGGPKQQSSPQKASDSDPSSLPRNILFATILPILQKFLLPWSNGTLQDWCRDWSLPGGWTESKTVQRRQIYIIWKQDWWEGTGTKKFINIDENGNTEENLLLWYRLALSGDSVIAYEHAKVWWKYSWNLPEKAPVISIHHLQAHRAWNLQFRTMMNGTKENACWQGLALRLKHWDIDLDSL